jgi:hypothetical protein
MEVYTGKRIWPLLNAMFEAFPLSEVAGHFRDVASWLSKVLAEYGRELLPTSCSPPYSTLIQDFRSVTSLACVIHHYVVEAIDRPDLRLVFWEPETDSEVTENVRYMFGIMDEVGFPVFFSPEQWLQNADVDFLMVQLYYVYFELKD